MAAAIMAPKGLLRFETNQMIPVAPGETRYRSWREGDPARNFVEIDLDKLPQSEFDRRCIQVAHIFVGAFDFHFGGEYASSLPYAKYEFERISSQPQREGTPPYAYSQVLEAYERVVSVAEKNGIKIPLGISDEFPTKRVFESELSSSDYTHRETTLLNAVAKVRAVYNSQIKPLIG